MCAQVGSLALMALLCLALALYCTAQQVRLLCNYPTGTSEAIAEVELEGQACFYQQLSVQFLCHCPEFNLNSSAIIKASLVQLTLLGKSCWWRQC